MDTIELEKLGSRKLKLSAKETMTIAEKLYTRGIISYPRTETNMFSKEINLRSLVENHTSHPAWGGFADRVLQWGPNPHNGNKSDQAHPPIHPTKLVTDLSGNEARVYELVVRHFLACVSKDAVGSETTVKANIANEEFSATGVVVYELNYLEVYIYEKWSGKEIHDYEEGTSFEPTELMMVDGKTSPPSLLTEADLIALMDKHGIGTDATHAEHINTIKTRGYIGEINNGYLVPGTLGMGLVEGYDAVELPLAYPELRAELERDLKLICTGERDPAAVLAEQVQKYKEVYKVITEKIVAMDRKLSERLNVQPSSAAPPPIAYQTVEEVFKCPKCDKYKMAIRSKKDNAGFYVSCMGRPECAHVIWLPDIIKEIRVEDGECRKCRTGANQINIRFKRMNILSALNDSCINENNNYVSCLVCDASLKSLLEINDAQLRRSASSNSSSGRDTSSSTGPTSRPATASRTVASTSQRNQWTAPAPPPPRPTNNHRNDSGRSDGRNNQSFSSDGALCPKCQQPAEK